jgi:hypothetical protein
LAILKVLYQRFVEESPMHPASTGLLAALVITLLSAGCTGAPAPDPAQTKQWLGRWNGPEGTYLEISGTPADYRLTIANLDGPRRFVGRAQGVKIVFVRDGVVETLSASDGDATGMKWLADKRDCLTVRRGEGYCRD